MKAHVVLTQVSSSSRRLHYIANRACRRAKHDYTHGRLHAMLIRLIGYGAVEMSNSAELFNVLLIMESYPRSPMMARRIIVLMAMRLFISVMGWTGSLRGGWEEGVRGSGVCGGLAWEGNGPGEGWKTEMASFLWFLSILWSGGDFRGREVGGVGTLRNCGRPG